MDAHSKGDDMKRNARAKKSILISAVPQRPRHYVWNLNHRTASTRFEYSPERNWGNVEYDYGNDMASVEGDLQTMFEVVNADISAQENWISNVLNRRGICYDPLDPWDDDAIQRSVLESQAASSDLRVVLGFMKQCILDLARCGCWKPPTPLH